VLYAELCLGTEERDHPVLCSLVRGVVTLVAMVESVEFLYILLRTRLRCSDIALDIVRLESSKTGVTESTSHTQKLPSPKEQQGPMSPKLNFKTLLGQEKRRKRSSSLSQGQLRFMISDQVYIVVSCLFHFFRILAAHIIYKWS
jgi:hypothetical protein